MSYTFTKDKINFQQKISFYYYLVWVPASERAASSNDFE